MLPSLVFAIVLFCGVLPGLFQVITFRLFRIRVAEVRFFLGPRIATFGKAPVVSLGPIPIGSWVRAEASDLPEAPSLRAGALRVLFLLNGTFYYAVLSAAALGPHRALASMLSAWPQFFWGTISPVEAQQRIAAWLQMDSALAAVGVLAAKSVSLSFLPLPATPLGQAVVEGLIFRGEPTALERGPLLAATIVNLAVFCVCLGLWIIAGIKVLWTS
jgi:hypothetical protein